MGQGIIGQIKSFVNVFKVNVPFLYTIFEIFLATKYSKIDRKCKNYFILIWKRSIQSICENEFSIRAILVDKQGDAAKAIWPI